MGRQPEFSRVDILICQHETLVCGIEYKVYKDGNREVDITYPELSDLLFAMQWIQDARLSLGYHHWKLTRTDLPSDLNPDSWSQFQLPNID